MTARAYARDRRAGAAFGRHSRGPAHEGAVLATVTLRDRSARLNAILTLLFVAAVVSSWLIQPIAAFLDRTWQVSHDLLYATWVVLAVALAASAVRSADLPLAVVSERGLSIKTRGRTRFFPLHRIASVRAKEGALAVRLDRGKEEVFRAEGISRAQVDELARRIAEARRAQRMEPPAKALLFERAGRSLRAWREDVARLVVGARDYRHAKISADELAALLAHPATTTEQRAGAALALVGADEGDAKPRIRIAADACRDELAVRALTAIAEEDDLALEEALAESRLRRARG